MDALTGLVDGAPPLRLPPPPGAASRRRWRAPSPRRRWASWLAPAAAAAAVIALAAALVIARDAPAGEPAGQPIPSVPPVPGTPAGVPRYYVAIPGDMANAPVGAPAAVVGDTFTGKRLATLPAPAGWKFVSVAGSADDRTFVVGAEYNPQPPGVPLATRWYLIRVTPGAAATLRQLPIPALADGQTFAMGLSPDGTRLAMMGTARRTAVLRIYSVATGAVLRSWSSPLPAGAISVAEGDAVSWTGDGRQVAFLSFLSIRSSRMDIRMLKVGDPGHDLVADSRVIWSAAVPGNFDATATRPFGCGGVFSPSVLVAGDGKTVVCGASGVFRAQGSLPDGTCPAVPPWNREGILEYSAATGKVTRTLYQIESNCVPDVAPVRLFWTSASGDAVIGYLSFRVMAPPGTPVIRFGLFTAHGFTPLPAPPTMAKDPGNVAW